MSDTNKQSSKANKNIKNYKNQINNIVEMLSKRDGAQNDSEAIKSKSKSNEKMTLKNNELGFPTLTEDNIFEDDFDFAKEPMESTEKTGPRRSMSSKKIPRPPFHIITPSGTKPLDKGKRKASILDDDNREATVPKRRLQPKVPSGLGGRQKKNNKIDYLFEDVEMDQEEEEETMASSSSSSHRKSRKTTNDDSEDDSVSYRMYDNTAMDESEEDHVEEEQPQEEEEEEEEETVNKDTEEGDEEEGETEIDKLLTDVLEKENYQRTLYDDYLNGSYAKEFERKEKEIEILLSNDQPLSPEQKHFKSLLNLPCVPQSLSEDKNGTRFIYVPPENLANIYKSIGSEMTSREQCFACKKGLGMKQSLAKSVVSEIKNYWSKNIIHMDPEMLSKHISSQFEYKLRRPLNAMRVKKLQKKQIDESEWDKYMLPAWTPRSVFDHYYFHSIEASNVVAISIWQVKALVEYVYSNIMRMDITSPKHPKMMIDPQSLSSYLRLLDKYTSLYNLNIKKMNFSDEEARTLMSTAHTYDVEMFDDDAYEENTNQHI